MNRMTGGLPPLFTIRNQASDYVLNVGDALLLVLPGIVQNSVSGNFKFLSNVVKTKM